MRVSEAALQQRIEFEVLRRKHSGTVGEMFVMELGELRQKTDEELRAEVEAELRGRARLEAAHERGSRRALEGVTWAGNASPPCAAPAPNDSGRTVKPGSRVHRTGRDSLAPLIQRIRESVADRGDTAQVWAELERLGRLSEKDRPAPLAGVNSGGVRWHDGGTVKTLSRKALGARLKRLP